MLGINKYSLNENSQISQFLHQAQRKDENIVSDLGCGEKLNENPCC